MLTTKFNLLDNPMYNLDQREEPMSVQIEVRASGRIEAERLAKAIWATTRLHPMARARMQPRPQGGTLYVWEIPDAIDHLPLEIVDAEDDAAVADARARLQSLSVPLSVSPPFAVTLVHHPRGDYLMLNVNHAAGDGMSTFRIITSIIRQYAGEVDPVPAFDPLSVRDVRKLAGSRSLPERIKRAGMLLEHIRVSRVEPVRVSAKGVPGQDFSWKNRPGYGFHLLDLSLEDSRRIMSRRQKPATVNDVLLTGLILAIKEWNRREGGQTGRISVMMPMNLRPEAWWFEVVSNIVSMVAVSLEADQMQDFASSLHAVNDETVRLKEAGATGMIVDLLEMPQWLPAIFKERLNDIIPTALGRNYVDTAVLSNLGRLAAPPNFGDAGKVTEVYFSPPGHMPMGVSVGASTIGEHMFLTLRYRKAQFDAVAAAEFAQLYLAVLKGDAG